MIFFIDKSVILSIFLMSYLNKNMK